MTIGAAAGGTMFGQTVQSVENIPPTAIDAVLADIATAWGSIDAPVPSVTAPEVVVTAEAVPYALLGAIALGIYFFK
jgi:hypothetical protein